MSRTIGAVAGQLDKSHIQNSSLLQREGSAFPDKQLLEALARSKMCGDDTDAVKSDESVDPIHVSRR